MTTLNHKRPPCNCCHMPSCVVDRYESCCLFGSVLSADQQLHKQGFKPALRSKLPFYQHEVQLICPFHQEASCLCRTFLIAVSPEECFKQGSSFSSGFFTPLFIRFPNPPPASIPAYISLFHFSNELLILYSHLLTEK